ncbi:cell division protein ZapD [Spiribacter sp. 2438]|uniref:cell division protein ZapD n=1 Tax=Spiribacter sp. 2438 TaxID=2666185 RepID=UPI0012AFFE69|nr:cell division protein ZapD [Spiribacter sp. 2438]QGM22140.1 cell division protein ZapD [Spiribacter sp. 2438]
MSAEPSPASVITYEYPLNERIRTFLRLEFLFKQLAFGAQGDSPWHTRAAVDALLDIKALLSRSDVRSELQKELGRMQTNLEKLQSMAGVDKDRLAPLLNEVAGVSQHLREAPTGFPPVIRDNEFLLAIEQRAGVLGGTCAFDLPGFHLWLESPADERRQLLREWQEAFALTRNGTALVLRLLRGSADPTPEMALAGGYQTVLDHDNPYQMLRVILPAGTAWYPEISGSRHYCNVRFLHQPEKGERPQQVTSDVSFTLERCVI